MTEEVQQESYLNSLLTCKRSSHLSEGSDSENHLFKKKKRQIKAVTKD